MGEVAQPRHRPVVERRPYDDKTIPARWLRAAGLRSRPVGGGGGRGQCPDPPRASARHAARPASGQATRRRASRPGRHRTGTRGPVEPGSVPLAGVGRVRRAIASRATARALSRPATAWRAARRATPRICPRPRGCTGPGRPLAGRSCERRAAPAPERARDSFAARSRGPDRSCRPATTARAVAASRPRALKPTRCGPTHGTEFSRPIALYDQNCPRLAGCASAGPCLPDRAAVHAEHTSASSRRPIGRHGPVHHDLTRDPHRATSSPGCPRNKCCPAGGHHGSRPHRSVERHGSIHHDCA